jgi:hypothetical protein
MIPVAERSKAWICGLSPGAWLSVSCECRVLSGRGLCVALITRLEESCRVWCVWRRSWSLDNEEAVADQGLLRRWNSDLLDDRGIGLLFPPGEAFLFPVKSTQVPGVRTTSYPVGTWCSFIVTKAVGCVTPYPYSPVRLPGVMLNWAHGQFYLFTLFTNRQTKSRR